jgi:hypothetical protein
MENSRQDMALTPPVLQAYLLAGWHSGQHQETPYGYKAGKPDEGEIVLPSDVKDNPRRDWPYRLAPELHGQSDASDGAQVVAAIVLSPRQAQQQMESANAAAKRSCGHRTA